MLTSDKEITKPEYWNKIFSGKNNNAPVDASNTVRTKTFDRFQWVVDIVDKGSVIGIASGHAHIEKRLAHKWPEEFIMATDQAAEAKAISGYKLYMLISGYDLRFHNKSFNTAIITQALEYFEHQDKVLEECKRVANKFICTVPIGEMQKWSQLFIYTEESFRTFIEKYGTVEHWERHDDLLLVKIKFHD